MLYWCLVTGSAEQVAVFAAHCVVRGQAGNDENKGDQSRQFFRHFELVGVDRRGLVQAEMFLRKFPGEGVRPRLFSAVIGRINRVLPGVFGDGFRSKGTIKMDVFTGELSDVVMKEALRLADKNQVMPGVAVYFHLAQAFVFNFTTVRG